MPPLLFMWKHDDYVRLHTLCGVRTRQADSNFGTVPQEHTYAVRGYKVVTVAISPEDQLVNCLSPAESILIGYG